jgi:hypothetical protein
VAVVGAAAASLAPWSVGGCGLGLEACDEFAAAVGGGLVEDGFEVVLDGVHGDAEVSGAPCLR